MTEYTNDVTIDSLIKKNQTLILNYYAKWCGPCKSIFAHLTEIKNNFDYPIEIININVDNYPNVALEQNVRAIPTLQYYKKGELYLKESGFRTKDHLIKNINALTNIEIIDISKI